MPFHIFDGLSKLDINSIMQAGMVCPLEGGKLLFRKGDTGHEMYVILTGKIDIVDEFSGYKDVIASLGPGEIFGEMAMFERSHVRSTHAVVREPSQVLVLSDDVLSQLLDKKIPKQFLANIIGVLCNRIRRANAMFMIARYDSKSQHLSEGKSGESAHPDS